MGRLSRADIGGLTVSTSVKELGVFFRYFSGCWLKRSSCYFTLMFSICRISYFSDYFFTVTVFSELMAYFKLGTFVDFTLGDFIETAGEMNLLNCWDGFDGNFYALLSVCVFDLWIELLLLMEDTFTAADFFSSA